MLLVKYIPNFCFKLKNLKLTQYTSGEIVLHIIDTKTDKGNKTASSSARYKFKSEN